VQANAQGTVHTVSPFDAERFHATYLRWPEPLRKVLRYYPVDSMAFFMQIDERKIRPDLVLIDGNHDYEFANFDLQASAQRLARGGFILLDNIGQPGPYLAVNEFIRDHPEWHDCQVITPSRDATKAFDRDRTTIPDSDFIVLRAPNYHFVGSRPITFGETSWPETTLRGLRLSIEDVAGRGTLHVQCILRVFTEARIDELVGASSRAISGPGAVAIVFDEPPQSDLQSTHCRVEPWLIWTGSKPLRLSRLPEPF
jgi:hypothetical protein